jgi:hypothetical protein
MSTSRSGRTSSPSPSTTAEILVGTFSYNKNAYGELAVKRAPRARTSELWYDERAGAVHLRRADRARERPGVVRRDEHHARRRRSAGGPRDLLRPQVGHLPPRQARDAFHRRDDGAGRPSSTTPPARSRRRNYIQKKAGLVAEHHHSYGGSSSRWTATATGGCASWTPTTRAGSTTWT